MLVDIQIEMQICVIFEYSNKLFNFLFKNKSEMFLHLKNALFIPFHVNVCVLFCISHWRQTY